MDMKACIQYVKLDGLIRCGPECDAMGKPYEVIVAFKFKGSSLVWWRLRRWWFRKVEILGMTADGVLRHAHAREIICAVERDLGCSVFWDRYGCNGAHKRRMEMGKHNLPSVRNAMKNGKLDIHTAKKDFAQVLKAVDDGKVMLESGDQVDGTNDTAAVASLNAAVASLGDDGVLVWFVRREN
jgi:hypothetical protein